MDKQTIVRAIWTRLFELDNTVLTDQELSEELAEAVLTATDVSELIEDAKTFRHLLDIAQQEYGLDSIGEAFTRIDELQADTR